MEVNLKECRIGPFRVVIAEFEPGDIMAHHVHKVSGHLSIVTKGLLISQYSDLGEVVQLKALSICYWPVGTAHRWKAVSKSTLINVFAL